jgi:hypothetical protein
MVWADDPENVRWQISMNGFQNGYERNQLQVALPNHKLARHGED